MIKKLLFAAWLMALCATAHTQGTVFWEENFDAMASLPMDWSQTSNATDGGWKVGTTASLTSSAFGVPSRSGFVIGTNDDACNCNKANEMLRTPVLDLSGQTQLYLIFDLYYRDLSYGGIPESLNVAVSTDGGATWTNIKTPGGVSGAWQNNTNVDVSAYTGPGMDAVQFAFIYNDGGGWLYGAAIDNIALVVPDDIVRVGLSGVRAGRYIGDVPAILTNYTKMLPGHEVAVSAVVNNMGFPTINSFDIYLTRNLDVDTLSFTGQDIKFSESASITFQTYPVALGSNDFNFNIEVANINGAGDDNDPSDNSGATSFSVEGVEVQPGRKVVVEEGTGTWCQWCPRGAVMMDFIAENYHDQAITIAVHNGNNNPMKNSTYDAGFSALIGGYPSGRVEREADIDPLLGSPNFEMSLIEHLTQPAKIIVTHNVELNPTIRKVDVTSSLQFMEELNGDYRIAVVFTEEGVTGTASGYAQVNTYSGGGNGPMGGFENLPGTVPASQMVYNHVARAIIGGFNGKAGSVPAMNPAGSVMSYTSSYIVPASYNIDNMQAITMVIDNSTGQIINAESTPIPFVSTAAPTLDAKAVSVSLAPNPVQDEATLTIKVEETSDVQVRIVDAFGRIVSERVYSNISGKQFLPFRAGNLANGMYTLVATVDGQSVSKPFVIAK